MTYCQIVRLQLWFFLKSFLPLISSVVRKFHKHRVRQTIKEPITNRNKYRHDCNFSSEAVRNNELERQTVWFELCQNSKASRTTYLENMQYLCILDQTAGCSKVLSTSEHRDTSQTVTQNSRNGPGWKRLNTLAMAVCLCLNFWLNLACTAQL